MTDSKINYYITVKCTSLFFLCTHYIQKKAPEALRGFIFFHIEFWCMFIRGVARWSQWLNKSTTEDWFWCKFTSICLHLLLFRSDSGNCFIKKKQKKQQKTDFHNFLLKKYKLVLIIYVLIKILIQVTLWFITTLWNKDSQVNIHSIFHWN